MRARTFGRVFYSYELTTCSDSLQFSFNNYPVLDDLFGRSEGWIYYQNAPRQAYFLQSQFPEKFLISHSYSLHRSH